MALGQIVAESLDAKGYHVIRAVDGNEAISKYKRDQPDICVLDIMMPQLDGLSAAKEIRKRDKTIPIIFLTAKTQTSDVLIGFQSGCNDYIRKPFSVEELDVRIRNLIQLFDSEISENQLEYKLGSFTYLVRKLELIRGDDITSLSHREANLLTMLCQSKNQTCDRKDILLKIWGDDSYYNSRNLDVYINKLRKIFSEEESVQIKTLKGVGYLFLC